MIKKIIENILKIQFWNVKISILVIIPLYFLAPLLEIFDKESEVWAYQHCLDFQIRQIY